jgi:hypothetical protein
MAGNSLCLGVKMGNLGEYCASCAYEKEDQKRGHVMENMKGRELLSAAG